MVKTQIIIFILLLIEISSQDNQDDSYDIRCPKITPTADVNDCIDRQTDDDVELGIHCCHRTNKLSSGRTEYACQILLEGEEYDDIDGYIQGEEEGNPGLYDDIFIKCNQFYVCCNLLLLFALLCL